MSLGGDALMELYASFGLQKDGRSFEAAQKEVLDWVREAERSIRKSKFQDAWKKALTPPPMPEMKRWGKLTGLGGALSKNVGSMGGLFANPITAGVGAAGYVIKRNLDDALEFDEALTSLDIGSRGAMGSMEAVRGRILEVSKATGVAKEEILSGAQAFVALTGDGKAASAAMKTFADVQIATGASTADIAATAAALTQQLQIAPEDMEKAFSILARGGKEGAVEFSDMAGLMATLSAQFKQFAGSTGPEGLAKLGAAFQIVRQNFGSAAEASTGLERLMESFTQARTIKALKSVGVQVFEIGDDGKKHLRPLLEIITDIGKTKLAEDPELLTKGWESSPARLALRGLLDNKRALDDLAVSTLKANDIREDADKKQESASQRTKKAWNEIKVLVTSAFTPERLQAFSMMLKDAVEQAGYLAGFLSEIMGVDDKVSNSEGDALLDKKLLAGHSVEDVLSGKAFDATAGDFEAAAKERGIFGAMGGVNNDVDRMMITEAAKRRQVRERQIAADDAKRLAIRRIAHPERYMPMSGAVTPTGFSVDLTINAPSADPKAIAEAATGALSEFWDGQMRDASAEGGP